MSLMCQLPPKTKWSGLEAPIVPRYQNLLSLLFSETFRRLESVGRRETVWTIRRNAAEGLSARSARKRENLPR